MLKNLLEKSATFQTGILRQKLPKRMAGFFKNNSIFKEKSNILTAMHFDVKSMYVVDNMKKQGSTTKMFTEYRLVQYGAISY